MSTTTTTDKRDPFAAVRDKLPTRYAPGATGRPYDYPHVSLWSPVIYYYAGEVVEGEGPIWLVEPYPAERADGTDGLDPVDSAGVAVLRGDAAPRPRGATAEHLAEVHEWTDEERLDGDWIIPGKALALNSAYDVHVGNQPDLMAAWCEAWAIANALNNGTAQSFSIEPGDVEILLAAERGDLTGDSRYAGKIGYLSWAQIGAEPGEERQRSATSRAKRLHTVFIEPVIAREVEPATGSAWTETTYRLTDVGRAVLSAIRAQGDGVPRCRVCGCTEQRACPGPGRCSWVDADLCSQCRADEYSAARDEDPIERFLNS